MSKKRILAGIMSLLLLITSVFTGNVVTKANATTGMMEITISGNGYLDYTFYSDENATNVCSGPQAEGIVDYATNGGVATLTIPDDAIKVNLKPRGAEGWTPSGFTAGDGSDNYGLAQESLFSPDGQTIGVSVGNAYDIGVTFTQGDNNNNNNNNGIQYGNGGALKFNVNNNGNGGTVTFAISSPSIETASGTTYTVGGDSNYSDSDMQTALRDLQFASEDTITISATPNTEANYAISQFSVLVDGRQRDVSTAIADGKVTSFVVIIDSEEAGKLVEVNVDFQGKNSGGSDNNGKISINCQDNPVTGGHVRVSFAGSSDVGVPENEDNSYGMIDLPQDASNSTEVCFKFEANNGYSLDTGRGVSIRVNGEQTFLTANDEGAYTYTLPDSPLEKQYELEFGWESGNNNNQQQDVSFSCTSMNGNENTRVNAVEVSTDGGSSWVDYYNTDVLDSLTEGTTFKVRIKMNDSFTIDKVSLDYESFDRSSQVGYFKESAQPDYDEIIRKLLSDDGYAITFQPEEASKDAGGISTLQADSTCLRLQYQTAIAYDESVDINWFFQTKDGDNGYGIWTEDVFGDGVGDSEVKFSFNDNNYGENGNPFDLGYGKENTGENRIQVSYDSAYAENKGNKVTVTPDTYDYFSAGGYTSGDEKNTIRIDDYDGLIDEVYIDLDRDGYFEASEKLTATVGNDPHIGDYSYYEETLDAAASYNILVRKHLSTRVSLKWSYTESGTDFYVDHGKIFIEKVVRGEDTLFEAEKDANGDLVLNDQDVPNTTIDLLGSDYGVSSSAGEVFLECGDEVTIRLIPTYGYQIESATLNGCVELTPNETVSSFTFTVGGNLHMAGTFVEATDVTDTTGAEKINDAGIADGRNATDSGNLKLTVADHSGTYANASEALAKATEGGTSEGATTIATLDMTLDSMVSKGNGQYWTDNITSFTNEINVNLALNDTTYEPGDTYVVVREHTNDLGQTELEKLTTTYSNGMLEVPTNKFSTYSIVKIPVAEEDRPNMYLGYDPRGEGDEAGSVTVKCNDVELIGTDGYYKYDDPAKAITFELKRPADRVDTTPVVEVVFTQEGEQPVVINPTVTNNTFTVTPGTSGLSGSPFMEVYVHWSEYDKVGPDDGQFMVILRKYSDNDTFEFQNNLTALRTASLDGETKYIFANGTNVSVEIQPGENRELVEVYVDTSGQLTHYSAEPNEQEGDRNIAELKTSDGKFVVSNLAPWTFVEAICIDLPVLSDIHLTNSSQTLYDTMKRSDVGISANCTLGGVPLTGTVELDGGDELLTVGEHEYNVIFTSEPNELGERIYAEGTITLKVLHKVDISGLGWIGTTFTYNGTAQGPTFSSTLPTGVAVDSKTGASNTAVGNYTAVANLKLADGYSQDYYKLENTSGTEGITVAADGSTATVTQDWNITAKDFAAAEITLGDALTYNGAEQTQTIASVKVDGRTLTAGTDYEITGNTGTDAGTYTLTINGIGNYNGTKNKSWGIGQKSITGATVTLGTDLTYDGTTQTQTVSSVAIGESTLTANTDYTITENQQKDAGTYTLKVEGTGNYTGTATKEFTISKATLTPALGGTTTKVYDNTTTVTATNTLTLTVNGLKNSETVTVTATGYAYDDANVGTGKTITATGITISGDAAKNYELSETTATVTGGEITQATPTITLSNLSETTQAPTGAKATLTPADASANVVVEYEVVDKPAVAATPEVPCNVEHEEGCLSLQEGKTIADCTCETPHTAHNSECGYKAATSGTPATYKWVTARPTTPGKYKVRAYLPTGTTNVAAIPESSAVTGTYTLTQYTAPAGDNTSNNTGSSSSSGSTTTTPTTPATTTPETPEATDTTTAKPATKKPATQTEETTAGKTIGVVSEDGSSGWTDIENEISDKLEAAGEDGETETAEVVVEMNGEKEIPTDIFEAIKGQNIVVTFEMGDGIAWTVNGMDVIADKFDNISFGASTGSGVTAIPTELIAGIAGENIGIELTLEYEGEFGFTAVMSVNVDKKNAGKYANLFYFNPKTETMEFICSAPVKEDGTTDLTFTHASDYVIVVSDATMSATDNTSMEDVQGAESGDTSDEPATGEVTTDKKAWTPIWIIVIGAFVIIIGGIVLFAVKKKSE